MKTSCFLVVIACAWSCQCQSIDYKKAAEIFKNLRIGGQLYPNARSDLANLTDPEVVGDPVSRFINFMRDYKRVYSSKQELFDKHANFVTNVKKAEDIQSLDRGTGRYSVNKFSDWSVEDLRSLTGLNIKSDTILIERFGSYFRRWVIDPLDFLKRLLSRKKDRPEHHEDDGLPTEVDWRAKGAVSKVKSQGNCQCCYAFSVIGIVEGMHAIKTGNMTELSVQQLVDCDSSNDGCEGGRMDAALQYIMDDGGVMTEKEYPYIEREHNRCLKDKVTETAKVQVTGYHRVPQGREDSMKTWIANKGPLSVGINGDTLWLYVGGVMDLDEYACDPDDQNHAVIAVGYGEEKKEDGSAIPYWIVKNSWGDDWGEEGYFRIRRGRNTCGISEFVHGVTTD